LSESEVILAQYILYPAFAVATGRFRLDANALVKLSEPVSCLALDDLEISVNSPMSLYHCSTDDFCVIVKSMCYIIHLSRMACFVEMIGAE
jgi:hypothetical protein